MANVENLTTDYFDRGTNLVLLHFGFVIYRNFMKIAFQILREINFGNFIKLATLTSIEIVSYPLVLRNTCNL